MIDVALQTMIDEVLPSLPGSRKSAVERYRDLDHLESGPMLAPIASLLDLNPLTDRAERLVKAARAAGADAADAVALRSMSLGVEVRDGRVEESESSEGDDIGLRVLVGRRQAMVSTNEISDNSVALADAQLRGPRNAGGQVRRPRRCGLACA